MNYVTIRSKPFGTYLSADGSGVTEFAGPGAGTVRILDNSVPPEQALFQLENHLDGTCAIRSVPFRDVYLRVDAPDFNAFAGDGSGTVNLQYKSAGCEQFRIEDQPDGSVAIASVRFPGVYLRMDGGKKVVNCQVTVGDWEKFIITKAL